MDHGCVIFIIFLAQFLITLQYLFWIQIETMDNVMLNKYKMKLTVMGAPHSWWTVGSALQLPNCNKWFYDADHIK